MARPLRLEFAGALYHVTSRGDRREDIYLDDGDRESWLMALSEVCDRHNWLVHAYCLMSNHYHLIVETPEGNLSKGMRHLNGVYTQRFNRRHGVVGHLFQGRYKAILVQKEAYLLELTRYVVLNPVRAGMVEDASDWPWSSYSAMVSLSTTPDWLECDWLLAQFGKQRGRAIRRYTEFVAAGLGAVSPLESIKHQFLLGDEQFVEQLTDSKRMEALSEISKSQRRSLALSLTEYAKRYVERDEAMASAYASGAYTMKEIGDFFGLHYQTVSLAVKKFEKGIRSEYKSRG